MSQTPFIQKPIILKFKHEGEDIYLRIASMSIKTFVVTETNPLGEIINLREGFEYVQDWHKHLFVFYPHRGDLFFPVHSVGRIGFRGRLLLNVTHTGMELEDDVFHVTDVEPELKKWVSNNVPV